MHSISMLTITSDKQLSSLACMEKLQKIISLPHLLMICSIMIHTVSAASDTINSSQTMRDGETMISSGGIFELGFFSPGSSAKRYLGMWYKNITILTIVWVANRESPLPNKSGALKITEQGVLVILNDTNGIIVWSSDRSSSSLRNPVAKLQDSGNLVVKDANDDSNNNFLWQSFDHPSDTTIPGVGIGWNFITREETYLSSWRSGDDPSPGNFTVHVDPTGYPQLILRRGDIVQSRLGPWNGIQFSGAPTQNEIPTYSLSLSRNKNEAKYRVKIVDSSDLLRTTVSQTGISQRWRWNYQTQNWNVYVNLPADNCDTYGLCGPHGRCNIGKSASCECLDYRFVPKDSEAWPRGNWLGGCVRRTNLSCGGDVFLEYSGIKMPDARFSWFNESMTTLRECRDECSKNCTCMAYTQLDIRGEGSGCLFYSGDLVDIRDTSPGGQVIYIRMASSESESEGNNRKKLTAILVPLAVTVLLGLSLILYLQRRKKTSKMRKEGECKDSELPLFKLSTILNATKHFSFDNKVGEGGFGPVYKGKLEGGQEIAVKRLSQTSSQGLDELKNEVILIAKLQHRNLVRLLGCCIEGEERMLVYEYMSNKSLDVMLFDKTLSVSLAWSTRFQIINGIARGLLYLHQDSRLRIIHRDLKASNILLDADMNPKISDFGTARSFGGNETATKTHRVVGTYGYMAPEYAVDGLFSVKSDVFSFGVLVLEIVSGKKNRGFTHSDHHLNLLGHAWTLYKQERSLELVDVSLESSLDISEALRSIHVGLLCVQKKPEERPSMSSVVHMLSNEGILPAANQPGFFTERDLTTGENSTSTYPTQSTNEVTITLLEAR